MVDGTFCLTVFYRNQFLAGRTLNRGGGGGGGGGWGGRIVSGLRCVTCASTDLCSKIRFYKLK